MKAVPAGASLIFPGVAHVSCPSPLLCRLGSWEDSDLQRRQALGFEGLLCLTNHGLWSTLGL